MSSLWDDCLHHLQTKVSPSDYSIWLRPLRANYGNNELTLYAQNQYVEDWVKNHFLAEIIDLARFLSKNENLVVSIRIGIKPEQSSYETQTKPSEKNATPSFKSGIDPTQHFDNFVQGRSNQLAKAVALQVVSDLGSSHCNPFLLYASTGLGKTHLLHAIASCSEKLKC